MRVGDEGDGRIGLCACMTGAGRVLCLCFCAAGGEEEMVDQCVVLEVEFHIMPASGKWVGAMRTLMARE